MHPAVSNGSYDVARIREEGALFRARLEGLIASREMAAARVPVTLSTHDVVRRSTHVIERGDLAAAIHASCAVPLMFHPVRL